MIVETITELIVKQEDIDELGHVNNSVYVSYLEKARSHWYSKAGISFDEMRKRGISTVVLKLEILYIKEALLDEFLRIKTSPVRLGNKSFIFEQIIFNQSGVIISKAAVTNVMFDRTIRKSIPVVEEIARQFEIK
jgi:YbgC/YbaW family acyl-CoA thioester hydrolase